MRKTWVFNNGMSESILNKMKTIYLRIWTIVIKWVAVVKFSVNSGGWDGSDWFEIKVRTATAKFMNVRK